MCSLPDQNITEQDRREEFALHMFHILKADKNWQKLLNDIILESFDIEIK